MSEPPLKKGGEPFKKKSFYIPDSQDKYHRQCCEKGSSKAITQNLLILEDGMLTGMV